MKLVKNKKDQQFKFLSLILLMFLLSNFSPPLIKLFLLVPTQEEPERGRGDYAYGTEVTRGRGDLGPT